MTVQTEDGLQKIRPVSDLGPHMKVTLRIKKISFPKKKPFTYE